MNTTERVIVEQFPYWNEAPTPAADALSGSNFVIVGCGTSYHLSQSIAAAFNLKGRRAQAVPGGEWSRRRQAYQPDDAGTHVIALSRSGESTETVQALEVSRAAGFKTTAITCEAGSSITRHADTIVYAKTHPEEGIVMTSSASLMLMMGLRMAGVQVGPDVTVAAQAALKQMDTHLPAAAKGRSHFVYLGAGPLYGIAAEGSIKVQEMSLSYAQSYHPMEYRHGPISLVDEKTFVVLLYSADTKDEEARIAAEVQQKGAVVVGIGGPGDIELSGGNDPLTRSLVALPPLQLLGERVAGLRNLDTTAPRHLNKVVVLG